MFSSVPGLKTFLTHFVVLNSQLLLLIVGLGGGVGILQFPVHQDSRFLFHISSLCCCQNTPRCFPQATCFFCLPQGTLAARSPPVHPKTDILLIPGCAVPSPPESTAPGPKPPSDPFYPIPAEFLDRSTSFPSMSSPSLFLRPLTPLLELKMKCRVSLGQLRSFPNCSGITWLNPNKSKS